jgi:catechol 2,3-dioxygenase-like lactoylglutathione lyase family enzyme
LSERPKIDGVHIYARDVRASVAFYRLLGLQVGDDEVWSTHTGAHHVNIRLDGGVDLEIGSYPLTHAYDPAFVEPSGSARGAISFRLGSREVVDSLYSRITGAGYQGHLPPFDAFWGSRYAIVEDPDGNHVALMSPADPSRRTGPPAI